MSEHEHHATEEMVVEKHFDSSTTPDMAEEIDGPDEILAEKLGISKMAALRVLEWHAQKLAEADVVIRRTQLARVVGMFVKSGKRNMETVAMGLIFASGTAEFAQLGSQADAARSMKRTFRCVHCGKDNEQTVTRALISHYTTEWADELMLTNYRFRRAEETRENCKKARIAAIAPPKVSKP